MKNTLSTNKTTLTYLSLVLGSFLILYYQVLLDLLQNWQADPNYSHGFFIPFLAAYMIWSRRASIFAEKVTPSPFWGALLILAGLLQLVLAWVGSEYFLQGSSMIPLLLGMSLFFWGPAISRKLLVPILFLIFMIPLPAIIWNQLAFPLALMASQVSAQIIEFLGFSILREGNILYLPNITLQVEEACSGLRSLVTLFALSAVVAYLSQLSFYNKWLVFLSALPVALVGNMLRLIATVLLARYFGSSMAEGFIHDFSGLVLFMFGLMVLILLHNLLARLERIPEAEKS